MCVHSRLKGVNVAAFLFVSTIVERKPILFVSLDADAKAALGLVCFVSTYLYAACLMPLGCLFVSGRNGQRLFVWMHGVVCYFLLRWNVTRNFAATGKFVIAPQAILLITSRPPNCWLHLLAANNPFCLLPSLHVANSAELFMNWKIYFCQWKLIKGTKCVIMVVSSTKLESVTLSTNALVSDSVKIELLGQLEATLLVWMAHPANLEDTKGEIFPK